MMQLKFNIADISDDSSRGKRHGGTYLYISSNKTTYLRLNESDTATVENICGESVKFMFLDGERAAILTGGGERKLSKLIKNGSLIACQISVANQGLRNRLGRAFGFGSFPAILEPAKLADGTLCVYVQFDDGRGAE